jgi:hypothetical protein
MLIQPVEPFGISIGTVYGERRDQPFSLSVSYAASVDPMPPIPLVTATPRRSGSTSGLPASAQASRAATSASCSQRSIRRAWARGRASAGLTAAAAAMRTGSCSAHGSSMRRTPLRPASIAAQVDATSPPSGVVAPSPLTTTPPDHDQWLAQVIRAEVELLRGDSSAAAERCQLIEALPAGLLHSPQP